MVTVVSIGSREVAQAAMGVIRFLARGASRLNRLGEVKDGSAISAMVSGCNGNTGFVGAVFSTAPSIGSGSGSASSAIGEMVKRARVHIVQQPQHGASSHLPRLLRVNDWPLMRISMTPGASSAQAR